MTNASIDDDALRALVRNIRVVADDPMWDAHAEVSKSWLNAIADALDHHLTSLKANAAAGTAVSPGKRVGQLVSEALALAPEAGLFLEITVKEAPKNG